MKQTIEMMTAEIGAGAQLTGCLRGPQALLDAGIVASLRADGHEVREGCAIRDIGLSHASAQTMPSRDLNVAARVAPATDHRSKMAAVRNFMPLLAEAVQQTASRGHFPLVLGGDHSCAVGTWSGVADAYRQGVMCDGNLLQGSIGLIWIDAHLDSHTPETSETQAPHGMPLAVLLGEGEAALTSLFGWSRKIAAENAVVVGARSYEAGEVRLLERLGVRVMKMDEVTRRGMAACLREAIQIASAGTVGYGISFDVDAIDPAEAPGVGSPAEKGLSVPETVAALSELRADPRLLAFELVEYNPDLDDAAGSTAAVCEALLRAALATSTYGAAVDVAHLLTRARAYRPGSSFGPVETRH